MDSQWLSRPSTGVRRFPLHSRLFCNSSLKDFSPLDKIFAIPQQHIADTVAEAVVTYCRNASRAEPHVDHITLCSSSNSLSTIFANSLNNFASAATDPISSFNVTDVARSFAEYLSSSFQPKLT